MRSIEEKNGNRKIIGELVEEIGYDFKDRMLLHLALARINDPRNSARSELALNERIEYLGDAILEAVTAEHIYRTYAGISVRLEHFKTRLVTGGMLIRVAGDLGLKDYAMLCYGKRPQRADWKCNIMVDTLEALIGAIYLDGGYEAAQDFIVNRILCHAEELRLNKNANFELYLRTEVIDAHPGGLLSGEGIRERELSDKQDLESGLGVCIENEELLRRAMSCSLCRAYDASADTNDQLVPIGRSFMRMVVTRYLFENYSYDEYEMSVIRAALLASERVVDVAMRIGLEKHLILESNGWEKPAANGKGFAHDAFLAVVGAIYLDQGYAAVEKFVVDKLFEELGDILERKPRQKIKKQRIMLVEPIGARYNGAQRWPNARRV